MTRNAWQNVPYLDALRPEPGWHVEHAVIATYSLDLVAVVAAMLALAGLDDEQGSGSKVDFANAHEGLRDRFRILAQAGRVAVPSRTPPILAIVDQFIREVPEDERESSWHPKAALVKLKSATDASTEWRLWLGSRNLTRDMSWDTGLILVATKGDDGQRIPGVSELGAELYRRADLPGVLPDQIVAELSAAFWQVPSGCEIEEIRLLRPDSQGRGFPVAPNEARQIFVVSPFLDGGATKHFGTWGDKSCDRWLLSSRDQLARIASQSGDPLKGYSKLFVLDAPDQEPGQPGLAEASGVGEPVESDDQEPESRGLHAKIVAAKVGAKWVLWMGSANATARGWKKNWEIVVRLSVDSNAISGLLQLFEEIAALVDRDSLPAAQNTSAEEDLLEEARKRLVAEWPLTQTRTQAGPLLKASRIAPISDSRIDLQVGLLGSPTCSWPKQSAQLVLPFTPASAETELVQLVLSLGTLEARWIQRVPLDPPPTEERDRQAIARYLDPKTFLAWIREVLNDFRLDDGGGAWNETKTAKPVGRRNPTHSPESWTPTLEEILKAWTKDPATLREADRKVQRYFDQYRKLSQTTEYGEDVARALKEFGEVWRVVRRELLTEERS